MKYLDFVNLDYNSAKSDLICEFFVETEGGFDIRTAAGGVAAESSIGTWTELTTEKEYMKNLAAKVFSIKILSKNSANIKIAYPVGLFEPGNMPNILSSVAGNVFGLRELKNLRLNDIHFPERLLKSFRGPKYGIDGVRKLLRVKNRPLVGTIIKPKLGLRTKDHAKIAYDAWAGGGIHGHPKGTRCGAMAIRQAVDAAMAGSSLNQYAKTHNALKEALEHFGK